MAIQWFYQTSEGRETGPLDSTQLRRLAEAGIVRPETLVRQGAIGSWVRAEQVRFRLAIGTRYEQCARLLADRLNRGSDELHEQQAPERVWPVTWAAIIVGSGTALLLLWALVFRGGSTPQQQAEKDQPPRAVTQSAAWEEGDVLVDDKAVEMAAKQAAMDDFAQLEDRRGATDAKQHSPDNYEELSASELYKRASPSSIRVENYDRYRKLAASGSGFLVSPDGQVVTNLHVIRGADTVTVRLSSGAAMAVRGVLRLDKAHDVAVLDIGGSEHDYLQLSTTKPAVGTRVYAIGNPLGLDGTLSEGVVSGWPELDGVHYIQTTAAISPGSSGGPLLSADGTVIGITTASLRGGQNLNLAVPASAISSLLNEEQQPLTLAQVNARIGAQNHQITIEDDPVKLAVVWDAIRADKSGDALRMLAQVPSSRRGTGYWIASGHLHFRLGNLNEAQAALGKAVANDPNNTESLLRLALALRFDDSQRSWDTPRDLCKRVMQLDPTNVPAHIILGICSFEEEEIGSFKTAVALDPEDFGAQYNLGVAMLGEQRDAWKPLQEALKLEKTVNLDDYLVRDSDRWPVSKLTGLPTNKSLHVPIKLTLAKAYKSSGQYERSIQEYKEVLAIEPNNQVVPWGLNSAYACLHNFNFKHPDAVRWKRRAEGTDVLPAAATQSYLPMIVYNYFGMLR